MDEDFDRAKKYLEERGFRIRENIATARLTILKDEDLADTAVIKSNGDVLVAYTVVFPGGGKLVLRPPQIIALAQTFKEKGEEEEEGLLT